MTKSVNEQFMRDVEVDGDDAHLKWEIYIRPCSCRSDTGWQPMNGNQYEQIAGDVIRRKDDAKIEVKAGITND